MTISNEFRVTNILSRDGTVNYYGVIFSTRQANRYFGLLIQNIPWEKDEVMFLILNVSLLKEKLHGIVILNICILIRLR